MDDETLNENGNEAGEGVLSFASLDTGDPVRAVARAVEGGQVSLALEHQMDGELLIFIEPEIAEELALALARAADTAREAAEEDEDR
jgi:hypothetical protein